MFVTASWEGAEEAVELDAACRTVRALHQAIGRALPGLDLTTASLKVEGRPLEDDTDVCGLVDGCVVTVSPSPAVQAVAALLEEGCAVDLAGFCHAAETGNLRLCGLYADAEVGWGRGTEVSPLHHACLHNRREVCALLLSRGCAGDMRDADGHTPLHSACKNADNAELCKFLLDNTCVDVDAVTHEGNTALHYSVDHNTQGVCKLLLEHSRAMGVRNKSCGMTPLHQSVYNVDTFRLMLDKLGDTGERITLYDGSTPLHYAANRRCVEACRLLLARNCPLDIQDDDGCTPLHCVAPGGLVAELLVDAGCDIDALDCNKRTPLHQAVTVGDAATCNLLLSRFCAINAQDVKGDTPLHAAIKADYLEVVKLLLGYTCDVDAKNGDGYSPLHLSVWRDSPVMCELLLAHSCELEPRDNHGRTPLHHSVASGRTAATKLLLEHGSSPEAEDGAGWVPLHYCKIVQFSEIQPLFLTASAEPVHPRFRSVWSMVRARAGPACIPSPLPSSRAPFTSLTSFLHDRSPLSIAELLNYEL